MEKYENLGLVGEGSYGMVLKCKHKESGQLVAIKKFLESEDDKMVKKIAMREVKMLKQLRHDHLVNLLEVFRRKKRLYLVFEYVDHTVLDELEKCPNGLDETTCRKILWQVLKGIEFCHMNNIIHRDIKPENILVSKSGVVKLCDFGFARTLAQPGEIYTDYVATRWYRAPELLVGDAKYGKAVDVWAVGCLLVEMLTGEPLFPGDSDIDQLYHIVKVFGNLTQRHKEVFLRNPLFVGMRLPEVREVTPLEKKFSRITSYSLTLIKDCLQLDPDVRPTCSQLLKHDFFTRDGFAQKYAHDIKAKISKDQEKNALLNSLVHEDDEKNSADHSNNKTTTKKKKKLPIVRRELKADKSDHTDHSKALSKSDSNKPGSKEDSKTSSEDKSKKAHQDPSDKISKKTPPITTNSFVSLPPAETKSKVQTKAVIEESSTDKSNTQDKSDKADKADKHDKHDKVSKVSKLDKVDKSEKSRSDKTPEDRDRDEKETIRSDKAEKDRDTDSKSENKSDTVDKVKGAESKNEHSKGDINRDREKLDKYDRTDKHDRSEKHERTDKHEKADRHEKAERHEKSEKQDSEKDDSRDKEYREKESAMSFKDSTSIPPIHPSGHNIHNTSSTMTPTSIPAISSPNTVANSSPHIFAPPVNNLVTSSPRGMTYTGPPPLRVNDKMVKKQGNYKKSMPNHHSVVISPQPLQSEKSHLHDKSLEKLRTQKRESTILEARGRDKEMISFPEVRGAEAAPVKSKSKAQQGSRSNIATIPHITNLDPFPSSSQVETHGSEKTIESNLPSV